MDCISKVSNDPNLSWKTKGMYMRLLAIEPGQRVRFEDMENYANGRGSTMNAVSDLVTAGYLRRKSMRTNTGYYYALFDSRKDGTEVNNFKTGVECTNPDLEGCIYVVVNPRSNLVKIGFTTDLSQRISTLKATVPGLFVHSYYEGTRLDEYNLHEIFIAEGKHESGEWFRLLSRDIPTIETYFKEKLIAV